MKRMAWITGGLTGLMVLLAALGAVGTAVNNVAGDASLYGAQSRQAVMQAGGFTSEEEVAAYVGLDEARQDALARDLAAFVTGKGDALPTDVLNEKESRHMMDVRNIVTAMTGMSRTCLTLAAALAVATAWTGLRLERRRRAVLLGALAGVGVLALAALGAAFFLHTAGFERAFIGMHELVFPNDLWLLNPETDILIRMMPQLLFEQAAVRVAKRALGAFGVVLVMLFAVYMLIDGMSRRQLTEKKP